MKLVRFEYQGKIFSGAVDGERIEVIQGTLFDTFKRTGEVFNLPEVKLLPPVSPTKIICVAHNYRGLIEQIGEVFPDKPVFFLKPPSSLIAHGETIIYPPGAQRVIFEGELAVVIRDEMRDVSEKEALKHILGYSCFNDVTERAVIEESFHYLSLGKGFDTFGPMGPYVVTNLDPNDLEISTYLNGELMQHDRTSKCIFSVAFILHYLSQVMTLYPGDIVSTGTPEGVAPMKPGDVVEVDIEGIGKLRNSIASGGGAA
jgi:2-keto-4-pentenoate hydratase/2-oxohepta-3-ene-1,7-dioic acid hydratase in catechol pathway